MKKTLKILGITLISILILMFVLPFAFQGKVEKLVKTEGNQMLNVKFDFKNLSISLFKEFPKASITLENLCINGNGEFAKDTLINAKQLTAAFDILSLFKKDYYISKIVIKNTDIHAVVGRDGKVNWDIMKPDTTKQVKETKKSTPFHLHLKKLVTENLNIRYTNRQNNSYAEIKKLDLTLKGNFSDKNTLIKVKSNTPSLTYKMNNIPFIHNVAIKSKINLDADFVNNKYTFKDNEIQLNAIKLGIDGWVAEKKSAFEMNLKLNTNDVNFKEILSLIPSIYSKNFSDIETNGIAKLNAKVKGLYQGLDTFPSFTAILNIKNAMFKYPSLPSKVDQINIDILAQNPGGKADFTTIDINKFNFRIAGTPFHAAAFIKTPVSDPDFKAEAKGIINLNMIKQIYPLDKNISLNGIINANINFSGKMSYINNEQYDRMKASGSIGASKMRLKMQSLPDISILKSLLTFSPQYANLSQTTIFIGKNDLTLNGKISNYLGYVLKGSTIKGEINLRSNHFCIDDFMEKNNTSVTSKETESHNVASNNIVLLPTNIDININSTIKQVLYKNMTLNNLEGSVSLKNAEANMKNLSMNTMGGTISINGKYSTIKPTIPSFKANLKLNNIAFKEAYRSMNMIKSLVPVFEDLKGNFSCSMNLVTDLDKQMSPIIRTLSGDGSISTQNIDLSNIKVIKLLASAIKKPGLNNLNVKNMKVAFSIKNGYIKTRPFDIKFGNYIINLTGDTGIDQTINYTGKVKIPANESSTFGKLANISTIDLKIGGTFTKPKISLDTKSMAKQVANAATSKIVTELGKKAGINVSTLNKDTIKKKITEKAKSKILDLLRKKIQ